MSTKPVFFNLFACCIPIKGYTRSILCDLQRNTFEHIPNALFALLEECRNTDMDTLARRYTPEDMEGINKFLNYLAEHEYGFWTSCPEDFPPLNLEWDYPGILSNAILEYDTETSTYPMDKVFSGLEALGCRYVQVRVFGNCTPAWLQSLEAIVARSAIKVVELVLPFGTGMDWNFLFALMKRQHRFIPVSVYGCPGDITVPPVVAADNFLASRLNVSSQQLYAGEVPERVSPDTFTVNTDFFCEAVHRHTGLNGKMAIDTAGNIRNHPGHEPVFGNAASDPLRDIAAGNAFRAFWQINNDRIERCRDCEYRYICMDNSELEFREEGIFKKQLCPYDPYTANWDNTYREKKKDSTSKSSAL